MTPAFDPYRKWLGIAPKDQPPNHYRLLGIDLFENDPDVIDNAADRQMSHVRTFQTGPHSQQSQKILNELAVARVCLLNADQKAAYDEQLRAELPTDESQITVSPESPGHGEPHASYPSTDSSYDTASTAPTTNVTPATINAIRPPSTRKRPTRSPRRGAWKLLALVTILCVVAVGLVLRNAIKNQQKIAQQSQVNNGQDAQDQNQHGDNHPDDTTANGAADTNNASSTDADSPNGNNPDSPVDSNQLTGTSSQPENNVPDDITNGVYRNGTEPDNNPNSATSGNDNSNSSTDTTAGASTTVTQPEPQFPYPMPPKEEIEAARAVIEPSIQARLEAMPPTMSVEAANFLLAGQLAEQADQSAPGSAERVAWLINTIKRSTQAGDTSTAYRFHNRLNQEYLTQYPYIWVHGNTVAVDLRTVSDNLVVVEFMKVLDDAIHTGYLGDAQKLHKNIGALLTRSGSTDSSEALDPNLTKIYQCYGERLQFLFENATSELYKAVQVAARDGLKTNETETYATIVDQACQKFPMPEDPLPDGLMRLDCRKSQARAILARKRGGNTTSELAVQSSQQWIIRQQRPDGSWMFDGSAGTHVPVASTSLALLTLLADWPNDIKDSRLKSSIEHGVRYLSMHLNQSRTRMFFEQTVSSTFTRHYPSHSMATITLAEYAAITRDDDIRRTVQYAVNLIVACQNRDGGWGGMPQRGNTSAAPSNLIDTTWNLMAINTARHAGILPESSRTLVQAKNYIESLCVKTEGEPPQFQYHTGMQPNPATTAAGYWSLLLLSDVASRDILSSDDKAGYQQWLAAQGPLSDHLFFDYCAGSWLMDTCVAQGKTVEWNAWNSAVQKELFRQQEKSGAYSGSWSIASQEEMGKLGGRLYSTCMATLILQNYYRYPPIESP